MEVPFLDLGHPLQFTYLVRRGEGPNTYRTLAFICGLRFSHARPRPKLKNGDSLGNMQGPPTSEEKKDSRFENRSQLSNLHAIAFDPSSSSAPLNNRVLKSDKWPVCQINGGGGKAIKLLNRIGHNICKTWTAPSTYTGKTVGDFESLPPTRRRPTTHFGRRDLSTQFFLHDG